MTKTDRVLMIKLLLPMLLTSCAAASDPAPRAPLTVKITPNHPTEPTRIRFDVNSTPYVSAQDPRLPIHERIRLGMRQLAQERLPATGYCPHGFKGPDIVLGRKMTANWFFFVDCLPAPNKSVDATE
ncbi:hypothetical protein AEM42_04240 [Betaproteobacteria bacterium UKL13-2]|jgi:hypothetical protein|nr:hypothetical protein AEM42_04240 [Betaproteobacteria bacterium UKL13-2]HCG52294.1 hypothetical protein [Betaproteobacteria bacterium]